MSVIHPIFPISIPNSRAKIILTPCPGTKGVALTTSLEQLKQEGAEAVLTLLTQAELDENGVSAIAAAVKALGMSWFHLPILDDHNPEQPFLDAWQSAGPAVHRLLEQGKSIVVHCKGGSGRSGLITAQILLERGNALTPLMGCIKAVRPNAFALACHQEYLTTLA
ncbi:MAG: protein phosphatase, partial [Psychromonas sp.]|nr:protein phosphatase [Psychromonas sp.]